jgi:glucose-6-phosphate 1-dehydrogenase
VHLGTPALSTGSSIPASGALAGRLSYIAAEYDDAQGYFELTPRLTASSGDSGAGARRLFYLATLTKARQTRLPWSGRADGLP